MNKKITNKVSTCNRIKGNIKIKIKWVQIKSRMKDKIKIIIMINNIIIKYKNNPRNSNSNRWDKLK
jgi:hypothetical protein